MAEPSSKPDWLYTNPNLAQKAVEPTTQKKTAGWSASERPPAETFNWLLWNISQWIDHFDDTNQGAITVRSTYNAILGGPNDTHVDLNAVMADATLPAENLRILIAGPLVFSTTQIITKAGVEIFGTPSGTISKGGGSTIGIRVNAVRAKIRDCRFLNWDETGGKAIELTAMAKNCLIVDNLFHTVTTDIDDSGENNIIANNLLEIA